MPRLRRLAPHALLLASALLAGCATVPAPVGDAEAAHAGVACPAGTAVTGFNAAGAPACAAHAAPPAHALFSCPPGQFVNGFDAQGAPTCAAPAPSALQQRAQSTGKEATQEVSSNLKVIGIYGVRNTTTDDLWDVKINVELSAGAAPMDLGKLVIRYSDGTRTRNYAHGPEALQDGGAPSASFNATWIRGDGSGFVMESGDLVQLHFNLHDGGLGTRTTVAVSLIPESGSPVSADFRTPSTYGANTVVTLR